jgi:hypothetical protein
MSLTSVTSERYAGSPGSGGGCSLYDHLLQGTATELPEPIRVTHCSLRSTEATGVFSVDRPSTFRARVLGRVMGFPPATEHVSVVLRIERTGGKETWYRQFGSRTLTSSQCESDGLLVERFGPISLTLALDADDRTLRLTQRDAYWNIGRWRLRLPPGVAPLVTAIVSSDGPALLVDVSVSTRWAGRLLHYAGRLVVGAER